MPARRDKTVYIRAKLIRESESAVLIQPANRTQNYWVPKSQIDNIDDVLASLDGDTDLYEDWEIRQWIVAKNDIPTEDETGMEIDDEQETDFNF